MPDHKHNWHTRAPVIGHTKGCISDRIACLREAYFSIKCRELGILKEVKTMQDLMENYEHLLRKALRCKVMQRILAHNLSDLGCLGLG